MFILETIYACATSIIPLTDRSNPPWLKIHRYVSIPVQTSPPTLFHQFLIPSRRLNSPRILSWPEETAKPPKTPTTTPIHETVSIFPRTRTKPPPSFPCVDFRRVSRRGRRQTLKIVLTREDLSSNSCSQRTSSISSRPEGYRTAARQRERERETVGGQYGREQNTEDARCLVFVVLLVAIQKKTRAPNARTFSNSFSFLLSRSTFPPTSAFAGLNATPSASNTGRNNRQHPKNAVVCNGWSSSRGSSSRVESTIGLIRLTPGVIDCDVFCFGEESFRIARGWSSHATKVKLRTLFFSNSILSNVARLKRRRTRDTTRFRCGSRRRRGRPRFGRRRRPPPLFDAP